MKDKVETVEIEEITKQDFYIVLYKMKSGGKKWWSLGVYEDKNTALEHCGKQIKAKVIKFSVDV